MKVIIAEKPSVARDIAAIVGANSRKDGYLEGNGYAVTWAFGHLIGLAMPADYGSQDFRLKTCRYFPPNLSCCPVKSKTGRSTNPIPEH